MKNRIFIILLLSSLCSFGQIDSEIKSGTIKLDTIDVKISVYQNRIETESYFEYSKSNLKVVYVKTNGKFDTVSTRENSTIYNDYWCGYIFSFENEKIILEKEKFYSSPEIQKIEGRPDAEPREIYNKNLNLEFLKIYIVELFEKLENYR